jgi:hypothetical protein
MTFGQSLLNFYVDTPAAVGQAVRTSLLLWQGEWNYDITVGTPYLLGIIGKHPQAVADQTVQDVILNTQGVTGITNYQSSIDETTRFYSVQATINTIYGTTEIDLANFLNY